MNTNSKLFLFLQWTWGLLLNIYGAVIYLICTLTKCEKRTFGPYTYFYVDWLRGGMESGLVFCIGRGCESCALHEMGHGIQNIIYGPLTPFLVTIPSAIRYWYRMYLSKYNPDKYNSLPPYDSIWFEGEATKLGEKYFKESWNAQIN